MRWPEKALQDHHYHHFSLLPLTRIDPLTSVDPSFPFLYMTIRIITAGFHLVRGTGGVVKFKRHVRSDFYRMKRKCREMKVKGMFALESLTAEWWENKQACQKWIIILLDDDDMVMRFSGADFFSSFCSRLIVGQREGGKKIVSLGKMRPILPLRGPEGQESEECTNWDNQVEMSSKNDMMTVMMTLKQVTLKCDDACFFSGCCKAAVEVQSKGKMKND